MKDRFDLELPAEPDSVREARRAVMALLASVDHDPTQAALAVSEAVTNAVLHAYRGREPGRIRVTGALEPEGLRVVVSDDGVGMEPRPDTPGIGLGLPTMASVADDLDIVSEGAGTEVRLFFALPD